MNPTAANVLAPLRPYQREAAQAIVRSVIEGQGLSFSVEIARQGGKNELSARLETALLLRFCDRSVTAIKAAPTLRPQALISRERLWSRLGDLGLQRWCERDGLNAIRFGRARQLFLSADPASNIVGHTADLLLEVDEAQDVDIDKFDKELQPMAASTGATTVFYGTAWDDSNLLERARRTHLEAEQRDGIRRHFEFSWQEVARHNPAYERFVLRERQRLGADHPLFLTQYCLQPLPGGGRLFSSTQLGLLSGAHPRLEGPVAGESYAAGLDIAGAADEGSSREHDRTVLTVGRVLAPEAPNELTQVEVVRHFVWQGATHGEVHAAIVSVLKAWGVRSLVADATGMGEPVTAYLARVATGTAVTGLKLTAESKSRLGFELIAAVNGGRLRLYRDAASLDLRECRHELEFCRAAYRANQTLNFYVDPKEGHDDYVVSLALLVRAAAGSAPRRARGRQPGFD